MKTHYSWNSNLAEEKTDRVSTNAVVVSNVPLGDKFFVLTLSADLPEPAPGQFAMLSAGSKGLDPYLKRPISFLGGGNGQYSFLIAKVGKGTNLLGNLSRGSTIGIVGPLGNAFPVPDTKADIVAVGGGVGVPPLVFLMERLAARGHKGRRVLIVGARSASGLLLTHTALNWSEVLTSTDDGSAGFEGTASELLSEFLSKSSHPSMVYTCGPMPMMQAVSKVSREHSIACYASLEARMGCGTGVCMGCAVELKDGGFAHVCSDGPVFETSKIKGFV